MALLEAACILVYFTTMFRTSHVMKMMSIIVSADLHLAPDSEGVVLRGQHHGARGAHSHDGSLRKGRERGEEEGEKGTGTLAEA